MKKLGNKGFTLVELIATIVILSIVISIGAVSITSVIQKAKEKDYELLKKEIKNATEEYYLECTYANNSSISCPTKNADGYYYIYLKDLVNYGFLKSNSEEYLIINPLNDGNISNCQIQYRYIEHEMKIAPATGTTNEACPKNY